MCYHTFLGKIAIYRNIVWKCLEKLLVNLIRKSEIWKYIGKMELNVTVNVEVSEVVT